MQETVSGMKLRAAQTRDGAIVVSLVGSRPIRISMRSPFFVPSLHDWMCEMGSQSRGLCLLRLCCRVMVKKQQIDVNPTREGLPGH
jgi:hypothetical protein